MHAIELRSVVRRHHDDERHLGERLGRVGDAEQLGPLQHQRLHTSGPARVEDRRDAVAAQRLVEAALGVRVAVLVLEDPVAPLAHLSLRVAHAEVELPAHGVGQGLEGEEVLVRRLGRRDEGARRTGLPQRRRDAVESVRERQAVPGAGRRARARVTRVARPISR